MPDNSARRPKPSGYPVAGERADHQQVALREIDEFGCSVDQHKPKSDQAVDTAHRKAIQGEL